MSVCFCSIVCLRFWLQASYFSSSSSNWIYILSLGYFIHSLGFNYSYMMILTFISHTSSLFCALGSYSQLLHPNGHFWGAVLQNSALLSLNEPIIFPSKPISLCSLHRVLVSLSVTRLLSRERIFFKSVFSSLPLLPLCRPSPSLRCFPSTLLTGLSDYLAPPLL